jgi:hypothetical protein
MIKQSFCQHESSTKAERRGDYVMNRYLLAILATCVCQLVATATDASSKYDGPWSITFVTQSGDCNPTYNYSVNIENGVITQASVANFTGSVTTAGAVRASITVQEKHASGSGKLAGAAGRGTWSGYSGDQRCAGYWTAQRAW